VNRCASGGCGYLSPRLSRDVIDSYYPPEFYWAWEEENAEPEWPTIVVGRRRQLEKKAKWLKGTPQGRLLDNRRVKRRIPLAHAAKGWQAEGIKLDNRCTTGV
jgi:hypothetical protein